MFTELGKVLISHFEKFNECKKVYTVGNNQRYFCYLQMICLLPFKTKIMLKFVKIRIIRNHVFTYEFGVGLKRRKTIGERVNC